MCCTHMKYICVISYSSTKSCLVPESGWTRVVWYLCTSWVTFVHCCLAVCAGHTCCMHLVLTYWVCCCVCNTGSTFKSSTTCAYMYRKYTTTFNRMLATHRYFGLNCSTLDRWSIDRLTCWTVHCCFVGSSCSCSRNAQIWTLNVLRTRVHVRFLQ